MGKRLPTELMTIRAGDVQDADLVELPELVYVWASTGAKAGVTCDYRWTGRVTQGSGLRYPTWHMVYDAIDPNDYSEDYVEGDLGVGEQLQALNEYYVALRIGTEKPDERQASEALIALHEDELVRVRRTVKPPQEPKPDVVKRVCEEAGLAVMAAMLEVVEDRCAVPDSTLDALTVADVTRLYVDHVGPAVNRLEAALLEEEEEEVRVLTRLDVERPFIVSGPDGEIVDRFTSEEAASQFLDETGRTDASVAQGEWSITNMIDPDAPPYRVVE